MAFQENKNYAIFAAMPHYLSYNSETVLFLDRDGVINRRLLGRYVRNWDEFEFLPGVLEAIADFAERFKYIFVVTNQQGIGKGLMTVSDLHQLHLQMTDEIQRAGGRIDAVYFCPDLAATAPLCRKPQPGMGWQAKRDFPSFTFENAIMVGDSWSDIEFANRLNMRAVKIENFPSDSIITAGDAEQDKSDFEVDAIITKLPELLPLLRRSDL